MRLKSSIFVSALLRQTSAGGGFGTVLKKGAEEAGSIFVVHIRQPGESDLYGPAPQSLFDDAQPAERLFEVVLASADDQQLNQALESQKRFDPDCWIVELDMTGEPGITLSPDSQT